MKTITTKEFKNGLNASFIKNVLGGKLLLNDWENRRFVAELPDTPENREYLKTYKMVIDK